MSVRVRSLTISEAEFLRQVIKLAGHRRWRVAHFRPAQTKKGWRTAVQGDGKGFPDLLLIREDVIIVAELKVGRNKVTSEQTAWLQAFDWAGVKPYVWTPADWPEIERVLQ